MPATDAREARSAIAGADGVRAGPTTPPHL